MVSCKGVFFSTIASSTIDPLVASVKDARIVVVSNGRTHPKRHFSPHFDQLSNEV